MRIRSFQLQVSSSIYVFPERPITCMRTYTNKGTETCHSSFPSNLPIIVLLLVHIQVWITNKKVCCVSWSCDIFRTPSPQMLNSVEHPPGHLQPASSPHANNKKVILFTTFQLAQHKKSRIDKKNVGVIQRFFFLRADDGRDG